MTGLEKCTQWRITLSSFDAPFLSILKLENLRQETFGNLVILSFRIDMYTEGVADLGEMIMLLPLCPPDQKNTKLTLIRERATNCYLPAFENVSGLFSGLDAETGRQRNVVPGVAGESTFTYVNLPEY
jgi:hypothetical protein